MEGEEGGVGWPDVVCILMLILGPQDLVAQRRDNLHVEPSDVV